jgi:nucleoside-diphosphate-sugar epimerase
VANRFAYLAGVGRLLTIYGDGEQQRSFIHIRDASQAIGFALVHPNLSVGKILNVVDKNLSVLELVEEIRRIKPDLTIHFTEQDIRTHLSFEANNTALLRLGWQPQVAFREGMTELVQRFSNFETITIPPPDIE